MDLACRLGERERACVVKSAWTWLVDWVRERELVSLRALLSMVGRCMLYRCHFEHNFTVAMV